MTQLAFSQRIARRILTGPEVEIQGPVADLVIVSENGEDGDVLDDAATLAEEDNPGRVERATSVQDMVEAIEQAYIDNGMNPIHAEDGRLPFQGLARPDSPGRRGPRIRLLILRSNAANTPCS
jgi:hypothetical protein